MATLTSKVHSPLGFRKWPVTIITVLIYVGLTIPLLAIHHVLPSAPKDTSRYDVNVGEAWRDVQEISGTYHPYNSVENDELRDWILTRINTILKSNNATHISSRGQIQGVDYGTDLTDEWRLPLAIRNHTESLDQPLHEHSRVFVFNDLYTNVTFSQDGSESTDGRSKKPGVSTYFESLNIMVYIQGSEDDKNSWWTEKNGKPIGSGGVLVNAHFDSVASGFGTTDDGMGVVTCLQLIKHFTTPGNQPKKGLLVLLDNGEEDGLYGAKAFTQHPMATFAHTFLNLEGAGAGGRALLLRSTDTEVTRFYKRAKYPFATIISADGFKAGFVRSQTNYVVYENTLGLRGLDVAFMEPRSRYHTDEDDTRHASIDSLWHMLSSSLAVTQGLTSDTSSEFQGEDPETGKVDSGKGTDAVWFDLFGRAFVVLRLHTLFAISVTFLVVSLIVLILVISILAHADKLWVFSNTKHQHLPQGDRQIQLHGMRGFFRFPIIVIIASGLNFGLAYLITKVNPYIVHSSSYAVWSMMLASWYFTVWFLIRVIDSVRPSALYRTYAFFWMFVSAWILLVVNTVYESHQKLAGGYFIVFYFAAVFLCLMISFIELFSLPTKAEYVNSIEDEATVNREGRRGSGHSFFDSPGDDAFAFGGAHNNIEEVNESTSLLRGNRTTFANYVRSPATEEDEHSDGTDYDRMPFSGIFYSEQRWSKTMPQWTWLLQFVIMAPIVVVLIVQIGLFLTSAIHQTGADGNSVRTIYMAIAILSVFLLSPLAPFVHRHTHHISLFVLFVLTGTLIYNLVAFPFSANNRLKLFFIQTIDLDTGINKVSLTGIDSPYLLEAVRNIPSTTGEPIECGPNSRAKAGLISCSWTGLPPLVVVHKGAPTVPPEPTYQDWLFYNVSRTEDTNGAHFELYGKESRACKIIFNSPISDFKVEGGHIDHRFRPVPEEGSFEIHLWSRTWEKPWKVDVAWDASIESNNEIDGRIVCLWSDQNESGKIPAMEEAKHYLPAWAAVTKLSAGLVEGSKAFTI